MPCYVGEAGVPPDSCASGCLVLLAGLTMPWPVTEGLVSIASYGITLPCYGGEACVPLGPPDSCDAGSHALLAGLTVPWSAAER